jgi:hypothetical protein
MKINNFLLITFSSLLLTSTAIADSTQSAAAGVGFFQTVINKQQDFETISQLFADALKFWSSNSTQEPILPDFKAELPFTAWLCLSALLGLLRLKKHKSPAVDSHLKG